MHIKTLNNKNNYSTNIKIHNIKISNIKNLEKTPLIHEYLSPKDQKSL